MTLVERLNALRGSAHRDVYGLYVITTDDIDALREAAEALKNYEAGNWLEPPDIKTEPWQP